MNYLADSFISVACWNDISDVVNWIKYIIKMNLLSLHGFVISCLFIWMFILWVIPISETLTRLYMHAKLLQSCPTLQTCGPYPARLLCPWGSPGKNTGVGCHIILQGILQSHSMTSIYILSTTPNILHCLPTLPLFCLSTRLRTL